jgi:hypothetical protein
MLLLQYVCIYCSMLVSARSGAAGGRACEARVDVTRKSAGPPPSAQWLPPLTCAGDGAVT